MNSRTPDSGLRASLRLFTERRYRRRKIWNYFVCALLGAATLLALTPLFSVFGYTLVQGIPGLNAEFFTQLPKPVGETGGGMANALLGTLLLVTLGGLVGVPWGIGVGLYLSEYPRAKLVPVVRFCADLLASVPSIIIGLFVYVLLVVPMKHFSVAAGATALAFIIVPIVARSTEEFLKLVPGTVREAGLALGLPRWKVILRIVLFGSMRTISTGIVLAIARVAGETAPLLFTAFNNRLWMQNLNEPTSSLPVQIYTYAVSPFEDWHRQAWAAALVLVLLVFVVNLSTRLLFNRTGR